MYASDTKAIIDIRNHCSHEIDINENSIQKLLHGTKTYQQNKDLMKNQVILDHQQSHLMMK